ncbi:MAG TPA: hypothetical protein VN328_06845, partial [Thermodesulfovibrionales bacterium]|nr:hypothetical protein [Thermodesulfovibrionales bacterium]
MNSGGTSADKGRRKFHPTADRLVHAVLICLVCFLSYSNTFNVPFQFDDLHNISEKPYVRDINMFFDPSRSSQDSSFVMRSVAYITFAVNYWIHGNDVVGYHILNTAIHLLNGFLVYFLVLLTFRTSCLGSEKLKVKNEKAEQGPEDPSPFTFHLSHLFPLAVALLFVSHPVQTQAVTYIVQRLASLATLFYLLSLLMYIKWRLGQQEPGDRSQETEVGSQQSKARTRDSRLKTGSYYFLSLISAVLAMKTKEIAFTLPLVIALYEFMFFGGGLKKRILYLVPLLLTMLIIPLGLISIGKPTGEIIGDVSDATKVGTDISRWDYLFSEFRVIVTYIRLLFFPVNQNLDYDYPVYHSFSDPNVFLSFLLLVSIFGLGVYLAYRSWFMAHRKRLQANETLTPDNELSAMSYQRLIAFGIFWFFITLFVESSVIPIADVIFEHRLYLPSVGFFIA